MSLQASRTRATVAAVCDDAGQEFADQILTTTNQDGVEVVAGSATARLDP